MEIIVHLKVRKWGKQETIYFEMSSELHLQPLRKVRR